MQKELNEKTIRLRYIRVLEKFITKTISLLKYDNFDIELYKKATLKSYDLLAKTKTMELYSEYPIALKNLAQTILDTLENHSKDFENEKALILKQSNLLAKLKNNNRYKKDKHKHKKFNDGY
ncbi:MAG: hypothetical protein U9R37_04230 [Campylobacterota bacterium]|nr:hypothetical protein [Campylobacterota bacterium]